MQDYVTLQNVLNYIEAHLLEELNFELIAKQVHMSSYEFHRSFRYLSGMTVTAYIRSRRLSLAGQELLTSRIRITDLALKYGYDTPESFTKAFTRFHGTAPRHARQAGSSLKLFPPLVVKLIMEGGKTMDYRITEKEQLRFIALVRSFPNGIINEPDNHDIPDFWSEPQTHMLADKLRALRPDGKKDLYGLCSPTKNDTFHYGIGVLIDENTAAFDEKQFLADGYSIWTTAPTSYAVFNCMGTDSECIDEMWSFFYKEFLPQMGYKAAQETDFEIYPEIAKPGLFCELWIPIKK